MICFSCGFKLNTGEETECRLCGAKFTVKCPACSYPGSAVAKYCFNCGAKIVKSEAGSSVQNFDTLSESRKNVAVIFADISGFTALSEKMDPEEVREIINDCFNYITKPVYVLEGTIDKYIGDCVMILFGAKYSHSDDAKRAVKCAMEMMKLIRSFSENMLSSRGIQLNLSVGINYGLVVTGSVGNYFDKDYTVMGDIVNTAQRLQASAGEGVILASESVYMETRDVIEYSVVKEITVKNKEHSIRCYIPLRPNAKYVFEDEEPFTGRESEMSLLNTIYNSALNSGTRCVTLIGEAGIGKTRLLKEFTSKITGKVKKIWTECSSSSQNRVYSLISGILMSIMNINPEDSGSIKQHRLISFLEYILNGLSEDEIKRNYDFLGLLMGLGRDYEFQNILNSMSFENIRKGILRQLSIFFIHLCKRNRLVIIADDIHWADTTSLHMLKELTDLLPDINVFFMFSSRSHTEEFKPAKSQRYLTVSLEAFSVEKVEDFTCKLLKCNTVDRVLLENIVKFTKGNPLFIKEFVSNIKRTGKYFVKEGTAYIDDSEINSLPKNLQSLILSNISELDDAARSILQAASVIGKDFSLSLVNRISETEYNESSLLSLPVQLNIISLKSVHTHSGAVEKIFTFNHDMEREAIYDSILNRNKKDLHRKIGEYIESTFIRDIESHYEILCTHFLNAGLNKKAREYYYKTAVKYKSDFNLASSLEYFKKFLEIPCAKQKSEEETEITSSLKEIGHIYFIMGNYELALEYLNQALQTARLSNELHSIKILIADVYKDKGLFDEALAIIEEIEPKIKQDNSLYGRLLQMKCNILRVTGNPDALSTAKKSEKALLKVKDYQNLSETMKQAGIIYFAKGDIDNALYFMNKSYKYAEKINNLESMAKVSGDLGIIYHSTGMISKAQEFFNKSMELSQKISYARGHIAACINLGILYMDKGSFSKAEALFKESLQISAEILSKLYECISLTNLADIMYEKGSFDIAADFYNRSMEIAKNINVPMEEAVNRIGLVKLYLKLGQYDKVPEALESARVIFEEADEIMYMSDYYTCRGLFELMQGNTCKALEYAEKAVEQSVECRSDKKKVKALRLKGNILLESGEPDKAIALFSEAIQLSEQVESDYEAAKSYYCRYKGCNLSNNVEEAEKSLLKAKEYISGVDPCRWTAIIMK